MSDGPTDWVSGERVFAPPAGTVDPDWLVPAVLERVPAATAADARAAVTAAWAAVRTGRHPERADPLSAAAADVVAAAVSDFRADVEPGPDRP